MIPADKKQCQAEIRQSHGPFRLGPKEPARRCENTPKFIAREINKGIDGKRGSMSLCVSCKKVFDKQMPGYAIFKEIK